MAAGTKTLANTAATEEIIAADENRDFYVLQLQTDGVSVYLAFGEDAADATGIRLQKIGEWVKVTGSKARLAVNGYTTDTPVLGWETFEGLEIGTGPIAMPTS